MKEDVISNFFDCFSALLLSEGDDVKNKTSTIFKTYTPAATITALLRIVFKSSNFDCLSFRLS